MGKRETRPESIETPPFLCYATGATQKGGSARTHTPVTAAEMKALEKAANDNGLLYIQIMVYAGRVAFAERRRSVPGPARLLVAAGRGNIGGDGFVMAREAA